MPDEIRHAVSADYGLPYRVHDAYEAHHLIPLELGGSNSIRNLWPQPKGGSHPGYQAKERLEDHLHALVFAGSLSIRVQVSAAPLWLAECVLDAPPVDVVQAVDALGVDLAQDGHAVTGPLGDLGGRDSGVEPR